MPVRLHHIVAGAHDLPGLARFWTQALGRKVLSERENEIVIGTDENAPAGMCFMPVSDPKRSTTGCICVCAASRPWRGSIGLPVLAADDQCGRPDSREIRPAVLFG
jgi:hypothetical protein